jgi:hypothetical protein
MAVKVAIVGLSPSAAKAPWTDPEWERWGLPWHEGYWRHMTRLFEMHDIRLLNGEYSKRPDGYLDRLNWSGVPLYMQDASIYHAIRYPLEEVSESIGANYFNSSIAYMMALAIYEGAEEISIFGVDMKGDDEYGYQKPNMEYLIGLARGKGIKVTILDDSPLCKFQDSGIRFYDHSPIYVQRYGWLG